MNNVIICDSDKLKIVYKEFVYKRYLILYLQH
jgi:hypothetical protein